jgi:hypothetical protein
MFSSTNLGLKVKNLALVATLLKWVGRVSKINANDHHHCSKEIVSNEMWISK